MNNREINHQDTVDEKLIYNTQFKNFLEIPIPILLIKRDKFSRYVLYFYNQSAQDIFAVPLERLINKEIRIFWPKESWDNFRKGVIASIRKGNLTTVESIQIEKEGKIRSFNLKIWKLTDSIASCIFLETIDKRLFTQTVLSEKLKYEELFKHTPVMMTNVDLNGKILDANLTWIEKTGYSIEDLIDKNVRDFFVIESNPLLSSKSFAELLISNDLKNFPVQIRTKSGKFISSEITARPLFDINGKFIRCYLVAHDVSELKAIQEEYENAEKLLKSLLENSASAILLYSPEKGIVECNLKAEKLFNQRKEELFGKKIFELDLFKKMDSEIKYIKDFISEPDNKSQAKFNLEVNDKNLKKFFEVTLTKIHLKDEQFVLIFFSDKSTEKIKDEKILQSEKRFQTLFEESINALKLIDINGKILQMNRKAREIFEEFVDKKGQLSIKSGGFNYQKWLNDFINSDKLNDELEYKVKTSKGLKIIEERLLKITFETGDKLIFSIAREVTRERMAEEELRQSEQNLRNLNDTKNRLIYILSHDLRAPTSSIIGVVNAILEEPDFDKNEVRNYLTLIKSAAAYQLDLINNLLDWSLLESGKFNYILEPKNLEYAIYNSINSIRGLLNQKQIKLEINLHSELVLIDLNLFSRILINLVSNAIKFSFPESKISIRTKPLKNGRIEISVKDNGVGFDKEIFDKLFVIKEKVSRHGTAGERGTGLGLSLCRDMVNILGGKLKIDSPVKVSNKKTPGSVVSFDVKVVERKILISDKLYRGITKKALKEKLNSYKIVSKNLNKYFNNEEIEYYLLIVADRTDISNSIIEKISSKYRSMKNIIVVSGEQNNLPADLKKTQLEKLPEFLENEINKIEFDLTQQLSIAKQMRKVWT